MRNAAAVTLRRPSPLGFTLFSFLFLFICVSGADANRSNDCSGSTERRTRDRRSDGTSRPCIVTSTPEPESNQPLVIVNNDMTDAQLSRVNRLREANRRRYHVLWHVWNVRHNIKDINNMSLVGNQVVLEINGDQHRTNVEASRNRTQLMQLGELENREGHETRKHRMSLPQCSGPPEFSTSWNDGSSFRLYFDLDSSHVPHGQRDAKIVSTVLFVRRKPVTAKFPRSVSHTSRTVRPSRAAVAEDTPVRASAASSSSRTTRQSPAETVGAGRGIRAGGAGGGAGGGGAGGGGRRGNRLRSSRTTSESPSNGNGTNQESAALKLNVYAFNRPSGHAGHESRSLIQTVPFARNGSGFVRINITDVADEWMRRPQKNLGLQIAIQEEKDDHLFDHSPSEFFEGLNCTDENGQAFLLQWYLPTAEEPISQQANDTVTSNSHPPKNSDQVDAEGGNRRSGPSTTTITDGAELIPDVS